MPVSNVPIVIFWMTIALTCFSTLAVCVRIVADNLLTFEVFFLACLVGTAAFALLAKRTGAVLRLDRTTAPTHVVRNVVQCIGTYAWAAAIGILPLAQVFALEFSTPIFTTALAILLLGERATGPRLFAVALGGIGILIIYAPDLGRLQAASLLPVAAAACFALSGVLTRRLSTVQSPVTILFWMTAMQVPMYYAGTRSGFWFLITPDLVVPLAVLCLSFCLGHFALAKALSHGEAITVAPLDALKIPLIAMVGAIAYDESVGVALVIGALVIFAGNLVGLNAEWRRRSARLPGIDA